MKRVNLTQNQVNQIHGEPDKYKKRDIIQDIGIEEWKKANGNLVCTWATAVGKSVFATKLIKRLRKQTNAEIHITIPTNALREQWEKHVEGIPNVHIFTIHSYAKLENPKPILYIADEAHFSLANPDTVFSCINDFDIPYRLYLSATLKTTQLSYLAKQGFKSEFNITVNEAVLLGLVPEFEILNVNVPFTNAEKLAYKKAVENEEKGKAWFGKFAIEKLPKSIEAAEKATKNDPYTKGMYYLWMRGRSKRVALVSNAENKIPYLRAILGYLNKKTIIFSKTIKNCKEIAKLGDMAVYHSQQSDKAAKKQLDTFLNNEKSKISSVNKLIAGFDDEATEVLVRHSFDSSELNGIQSLGRLLRVDPNNPDKAPMMINFVVEPWENTRPCDHYWLDIGLKRLKRKSVTLKELINELKGELY